MTNPKASTATEVRLRFLSAKPAELGIEQPGAVWGFAMDRGLERGASTIVALSDGSASFFTTRGFMITDRGEEERRAAATRLCALAEECVDQAAPALEFPYPGQGRVRFHLMTPSGVRAIELEEQVLATGRDAWSRLFTSASELVVQLRDVSGGGGGGGNWPEVLYAIQANDPAHSLEAVRELHNLGAELDIGETTGVTPLMTAASRGHASVIAYLLEHGVDPDAQDRDGRTALMFAASAGHVDCVTSLLGKGADPNVLDGSQSAALMFAAQHGYDEIITLLLNHGARTDLVGTHGLSAEGIAEHRGHRSTVALLRAS